MKPLSPIPLYVLALVTAVSAPISLSAAENDSGSNDTNATAPDQPGRGGRGRGAGRGGAGAGLGSGQVERLATQLSLTDDQKAKITAIYEKAREEAQAARGEQTPETMAAIMAKVRTDVRAVLTTEQQEKFDALPAGRGAGRGARGGRGGPPEEVQAPDGAGPGPGPGGPGGGRGGRGGRGPRGGGQ